jgi:pimeloyl-ACP methyl ester carboxylesterase
VRCFLGDLPGDHTLIRYDMRGSGLSDRDVSDFSIPALVRDLEAVVDHLGLSQFALMSLGDVAGPIALTYAAGHPARVTHLVLNSGFLRGADLSPGEPQRALVGDLFEAGGEQQDHAYQNREDADRRYPR